MGILAAYFRYDNNTKYINLTDPVISFAW